MILLSSIASVICLIWLLTSYWILLVLLIAILKYVMIYLEVIFMNFDYAVSYIIIGLISWIVCYLIVFFLLKQKKMDKYCYFFFICLCYASCCWILSKISFLIIITIISAVIIPMKNAVIKPNHKHKIGSVPWWLPIEHSRFFCYMNTPIKLPQSITNSWTAGKVMLYHISPTSFAGGCFPAYAISGGIKPLTCTIFAPIYF